MPKYNEKEFDALFRLLIAQDELRVAQKRYAAAIGEPANHDAGSPGLVGEDGGWISCEDFDA